MRTPTEQRRICDLQIVEEFEVDELQHSHVELQEGKHHVEVHISRQLCDHTRPHATRHATTRDQTRPR